MGTSQQLIHKPGTSLQEVLAVVHDQEQLPISQDLCERVSRAALWDALAPPRPPPPPWHEGSLGKGSKLNKPHTVWVGLDEVAGHL